MFFIRDNPFVKLNSIRKKKYRNRERKSASRIHIYIYIYVYATFSGGISFGNEQPLESFVVRKKVRRVHAYSRQQKFIHGACDIEAARGRVSVVFDRVSCGRSYSAGTRSRAYASVSSPRRQRENPRAPIRKAGKVRVNG